jgi:hypothetical protein
VGGWLDLARLGPERMGEHVIRFGGIVHSGEKPRVGAKLAEPMPYLHQRRHTGSCERPPPALPALEVFVSTPSCSASVSWVRPADSRMSLSR